MRQPGYGMDTGAVKVMKMADGSRLGVKQANEFDLQFEANQNLVGILIFSLIFSMFTYFPYFIGLIRLRV